MHHYKNLSLENITETIDGILYTEEENVLHLRELKKSHSWISQACSGKIKTAYGFKWKYTI